MTASIFKRMRFTGATLTRLLILTVTVVIVWALKEHYRSAPESGLRWILAPTAGLVQVCSGTTFSFEAGTGYSSADNLVVIARACAGINFMIVLLLVSVTGSLRHVRSLWQALVLLMVSLFFAWAGTVVVNSLRILLAMVMYHHEISFGYFTQARLHRIEGITVYLSALSLLGPMMRRLNTLLLQGSLSAAVPACAHTPHRMNPFLMYIAVLVGIPIVRGVIQNGGEQAIEHLATTTLLAVFFGVVYLIASRRKGKQCRSRS